MVEEFRLSSDCAMTWHCALCAAGLLDLSQLPQKIGYLAIDFVTRSASYGQDSCTTKAIVDSMGLFLNRSHRVLRNIIKQARVDKVNELAKDLTGHVSAGQAAQEWQVLHTLQRFGGKASRFCSDGLPMRIDLHFVCCAMLPHAHVHAINHTAPMPTTSFSRKGNCSGTEAARHWE